MSTPPERWWGRPLAESRWALELARLSVDPVVLGRGVAHGDGRPVVLMPGFLAGDQTLLVLAAWLATDYFLLREQLDDAEWEVFMRTRRFVDEEVLPVITARRDGDAWVLDGEKRWIGSGTIADVIVVWARSTEDGEVKGFLVEAASPGYEATVIEGKGCGRAVWQADIRLDGVRVPEASRLPGAHSFKDPGRVLVATRGIVAWGALGHAVAAYDIALSHAKRRRQFGRPLAGFQLVQDRLVKMLAEVTGMQLYCLQLARLADGGRLSDTIAGLGSRGRRRSRR